MKTDQRSSFSRRMIIGGGKAAVAIGALAGAASWASKGYTPASAPALVAAAPRVVADEPTTTGSIAPRAPLEAASAKPAPEKAQVRVPDFDQRALALLAAGTTAEGAPTRSKVPAKVAAAKPVPKAEPAKPELAKAEPAKKAAAKPEPAKEAAKPGPAKAVAAKPAATKVQ